MSDYRYIESGLDNVTIIGANFTEEIDGEECLSIPQIGLLHTIILIGIVMHKYAMTSAELQFIRVELGLTQDQLAELLHSNPQQIDHWERDVEPLDRRSEILLRQLVIDRLGQRASEYRQFDIDISPLIQRIDSGIEDLSKRVLRAPSPQTIYIELNPDPDSPSGMYKLADKANEEAA